MAPTDETPDLLEWFRLDRAGGTRWLLGAGRRSASSWGPGSSAAPSSATPPTASAQHQHSSAALILLFGLFIAFGGHGAPPGERRLPRGPRRRHPRPSRVSGDVVVAWESHHATCAPTKRAHHPRRSPKETTCRCASKNATPARRAPSSPLTSRQLRRKAQMAELTFAGREAASPSALPHVRPGSVKPEPRVSS